MSSNSTVLNNGNTPSNVFSLHLYFTHTTHIFTTTYRVINSACVSSENKQRKQANHRTAYSASHQMSFADYERKGQQTLDCFC